MARMLWVLLLVLVVATIMIAWDAWRIAYYM